MIYHIASAADWDAALEAGEYRTSTLGRTLEQVGFIHAAFADQVRDVADRYYQDVAEPLVLLTIDETRLDVPVRVDDVPGSDQGFPHVYGPIEVAAVVMNTPLPRGVDGGLEIPALPPTE